MKFGTWIAVGIMALATSAYAQDSTNKQNPSQNPSQTNPQQAPPQTDQTPPQTDQNKTVVTMSDLPAAVKTTVARESKGKTIEEMSKVEQNGKTIYQVDVAANGKSQQLDISETGAVLKRHPKHDDNTTKGK